MWRLNIYYFFTQNGFNLSRQLLLALLLAVLVIAFLSFCRCLAELVLNQLENRFQNGRFKIWLSIANNLSYFFIVFTGLFLASFCFYVPYKLGQTLDALYTFVLVWTVINFIREMIGNSIRLFLMNKENVSKEAIKTALNFTDVMSLIVLWVIAGIVALQFADYNIQGLLGGLGVASIIVAFSLQSALKDVLAFFSIYIDRSFAVGDYIVFGNIEGTIKEIRLRTTKITALKGNDIIIPNDKLTSGIIENYNRLPRRRVSLSFTVDSDLSSACCRQFLRDLQEALDNEPSFIDKITVKSVVFDVISDQGLIFKIIYNIKGGDYLEHLHFKEEINLLILDILAKNKIKLIEAPVLQGK
ncbi:MAG: mechanosensitive ion channel family protein [bacterium]|nr:mechanosensitive ion channel family protein [bacterium]